MVRVRLEQRSPVRGAVAENADRVVAVCDDARGESDLVVFPELFVTGYHLDTAALQSAEGAVVDALARIRDASRDLTVVVGTPLYDSGTVNAAVVFDDGARAGAFHKVHLYGEEASRFEAGDELVPIETRLGSIGVEICYDLEFPESARTLSVNGADLIVTISANMRPFERYQETYARARAMENSRPHLVCNRVGAEATDDFFGESVVVDAAGTELAKAPADVETTVSTVVPDVETDESLRYHRDRRPEVYR